MVACAHSRRLIAYPAQADMLKDGQPPMDGSEQADERVSRMQNSPPVAVMSTHDVEEMLKRVLEGGQIISNQTHNEHHKWLKTMIPFIDAYAAEQKRKQEQWEKIKSTILSTTVAAALIAFGAWLIKTFTK